jgi:cobyrinic acid a,c-diamide synthase
MVSVPRLVIAAPSSGAGKTTVATGLMAALQVRGLGVSPHKVGPDYIDPGYHALATGRPGRNLDPVLVGEQLVVPLFLHGAEGADVAVVEGVMGLYDGRGSSSYGSTAHVASLLGAPVVLVVDASSMSRSVAALVHGFQTYDAGLPAGARVDLAGVVLNRVGSDRHEQLLRESLRDVPVLGVLRRDAGIEVPSRHLGLVPAAERAPEAVATVRRLGELCAAALDLDALLAVARSAGPLAGTAWQPPAPQREAGQGQAGKSQAGEDQAVTSQTADERPAPRPVIAVAGGAAFTFAYAELTEVLHAAGGDVVVVDPLCDERLPTGTTALVLPGGFPEVHVAQLAANRGFLGAVRGHLAGPTPTTYAECAGLLLLSASLDGTPMVGHFDARAQMTPRLTLGYRTAMAVGDNLVAEDGSGVTGHEFHRTVVAPRGVQRPAWRLEDGSVEGFTTGTAVLASYLHLHPAGVPGLGRRIVASAARSAVAA